MQAARHSEIEKADGPLMRAGHTLNQPLLLSYLILAHIATTFIEPALFWSKTLDSMEQLERFHKLDDTNLIVFILCEALILTIFRDCVY